jgi:hypothetical protein
LSRLATDEPDVRISLFTADADRKRIVEISTAANREIYSDPEVQCGSERWIRTRGSSVQKFRDGLTIDASRAAPNRDWSGQDDAFMDAALGASRGPKDGYSKLMLSAPLIGIIAVHDRENCLRAGRTWAAGAEVDIIAYLTSRYFGLRALARFTDMHLPAMLWPVR